MKKLVALMVCVAFLLSSLGASPSLACGEAGASDMTRLSPDWDTLVLLLQGTPFESDPALSFMAQSVPQWLMQAVVMVVYVLLLNRVIMASTQPEAIQVPLEAEQAVTAYLERHALTATVGSGQTDSWSVVASASRPGSADELCESLVMIAPVPARGRLSEVDPDLKAQSMLTAGEWRDLGKGLWSVTYSLKEKYRDRFDLAQIVWPLSLLRGATRTSAAAGAPVGGISPDDAITVYIQEK